MRVLMIVSNDVVHDSRVLKEAKALVAAGHEIRFMGWDRSGRLPPRAEWDGLRITYVRTKGAMRLAGHDLIRNPLWWRSAYRMSLREPFDVVHCHDLDTLPVGVRLKKATRCLLVYDAHEVFGYMIERDLPRFVVNYSFRLERRLAPVADCVIAANEPIKAYVESITGSPAVIIRNTQERILESYRPPPGPPFTILYVGTLHKSRFLLQAIETVSEMPDIRLRIGGGKSLASRVASMCARIPNAQYLGLVPNEDVLPLTVESHAVLCLFDPEYRINQVGLPNKVFEAMAAGRPSIVTEGLYMAKLVEKERCGLAVEYTREGFRQGVERLQDDPGLAETLGRNGLAAAKREYNWALEGRRLVSLYEELRVGG